MLVKIALIFLAFSAKTSRGASPNDEESKNAVNEFLYDLQVKLLNNRREYEATLKTINDGMDAAIQKAGKLMYDARMSLRAANIDAKIAISPARCADGYDVELKGLYLKYQLGNCFPAGHLVKAAKMLAKFRHVLQETRGVLANCDAVFEEGRARGEATESCAKKALLEHQEAVRGFDDDVDRHLDAAFYHAKGCLEIADESMEEDVLDVSFNYYKCIIENPE